MVPTQGQRSQYHLSTPILVYSHSIVNISKMTCCQIMNYGPAQHIKWFVEPLPDDSLNNFGSGQYLRRALTSYASMHRLPHVLKISCNSLFLINSWKFRKQVFVSIQMFSDCLSSNFTINSHCHEWGIFPLKSLTKFLLYFSMISFIQEPRH